MRNEIREKIRKIEKEIKDWEFCKIKILEEIIKKKMQIRDLESILKERENEKNKG